MSFSKNVITNYFSRFYNIIISIAIIPLYLKYLGTSAFSLIGLYALMQSWLSLLDIGLTPTLSREVAYFHNMDNGFLKIKQLLRSLELLFFIINLILIFLIKFGSYWIAHHWLKVSGIDYSEVITCITIIGIMISCRFYADLYRAGITGMEEQVWLNSISIILITLQYGGAYILVRFVTQIPSHFFEYQLIIAAIEPIFLGKKFYKIISTTTNPSFHFKTSLQTLKKILPLTSSFFYTAIIWTILTQTDKLALSHLLSLKTYGYFTLATIIASSILQCSAPISMALLPKMTRLLSQGENEKMLQLYRQTTQMIAVITLPLTGIIAIFGTEIVYLWTGNLSAASWAGPIIFWYALGNGFLSLSAFQYYLQFSHGNLKFHVIFNTLLALISSPLIFFSAYHYGAKGTGIAWFLIQGITFFVWPPIVHHKFAAGVHKKWLLNDIFPIFAAVSITLFCIKKIPIHFELINRLGNFTIIVGLTILVLMLSVPASSTCRDYLISLFQRKGI